MRFRRLLSVAVLGVIVAGAAITTTAVPASVASAASATSAFVAMPTAQRLVDTRLVDGPAGRWVAVGERHRHRAAAGAGHGGGRRAQPHGHGPRRHRLLDRVAAHQPAARSVEPQRRRAAVARPGRDPEPRDRPGRCRRRGRRVQQRRRQCHRRPPRVLHRCRHRHGRPVPAARRADPGARHPQRQHLPRRRDPGTSPCPGAAGASAVAVNLTAVTGAPGYWQVYPQGGAQPATSNLNSPAGFPAVAANQAIVTVDPSGGITIFSEAGGDLIIDVVGTYTGSAAPADTAGLFVPMTSPTRIVDTRVAALNPLGGTTRAQPDWTFEVPVAAHPGDRLGPTWPPSCSMPPASTRSCPASSPWAPPAPWPPAPSRPRRR